MKYNLDPDRKIKIAVGDNDSLEFRLRDILVAPDAKISLKKDFNPGFTGGCLRPPRFWRC